MYTDAGFRAHVGGPTGTYQVIVAGGGPAGLGAALAAARQGASTLLLEVRSFFGGVAGVRACSSPKESRATSATHGPCSSARAHAIIRKGAADGGVQLFWAKCERTCQMDVLASGNGAEIWLRSRGTA